MLSNEQLLKKLQRKERIRANVEYPPGFISGIEKKYNAKFVGQFQLQQKDGSFTPWHHPVFYKEDFDASKNQSEYFAISKDLLGKYWISSADWITIWAYRALVNGDNIGYSRSGHDYTEVGDAAIDGGVFYERIINFKEETCKLLRFQVNKGEFVEYLSSF